MGVALLIRAEFTVDEGGILALPDAKAGPFAPGLRARFEAFWLSPEIEAEDIHSNLEVVKDLLKSSKQCTAGRAEKMH